MREKNKAPVTSQTSVSMVTEFGITPTDGSSTREKIRHTVDEIYIYIMFI